MYEDAMKIEYISVKDRRLEAIVFTDDLSLTVKINTHMHIRANVTENIIGGKICFQITDINQFDHGFVLQESIQSVNAERFRQAINFHLREFYTGD